MKWRNVKLILTRELRDQLRDRRTLFTVLVMPLLLYPLLGAALLQVSQFSREHPTRVWLVGGENLPEHPPLVQGTEINKYFLKAEGKPNIEVVRWQDDKKILAIIDDLITSETIAQRGEIIRQLMQQELELRNSDVAILVTGEINIEAVANEGADAAAPKIMVFSNSTKDKSTIAADRLGQILAKYKQALLVKNLVDKEVKTTSLDSFHVVHSDVADEKWKQAATWSKILPFVVMIWCLTGAFYPAVDLCAGEKERGTFETLLSSPALRSEIAIGKLLTVILFSITTSLLNLLSMGFTGIFVVSRISAQMASQQSAVAALGMPPVSSLLWLVLALVPISALFSAVALAAASFAKSSKEGQYYLVPLMMISMPLMMLPMMPAAKLDLGSSLIPVSGLMLMLRGLIEGRYSEVLPYVGPVVGVTLVFCWLAIRWVVVQFSRESVIFVPSERFSVEVWLKQIMRERGDLPFVGQAILCGVLILVIKFFVSLGASVPTSFLHFSRQTLILLVSSVAVPAVMMAMFLTRRPMKSLRLRTCSIPVACAAVLLAICFHPSVAWLSHVVLKMYPPGGDLAFAEQIMSMVMNDAPGFWAVLLVLALAPAIFEELAFRGFVLSGLQNLRNDAQAILLSALLFGAAHSILQQSIITFFVGCILGYVAIKTNSLIPCVLYHFTHNSLSTCMPMEWMHNGSMPVFQLLYEKTADGGTVYSTVPAVLMTLVGMALLLWFWNLPKWESEGNGQTLPALDMKSFVTKSQA